MQYKVINLLSQANNGVWRTNPYPVAYLLPMESQIEAGQLTAKNYAISEVDGDVRLYNWNFQNIMSDRKVNLSLDVMLDLPIEDETYILCRTDVSSCQSSQNRYIAICIKTNN